MCGSWSEWQEKIDKWEHAIETAAVSSVAELDAVDAAAVLVPLKDRDRTLLKSKESYGGHVKEVKDVVRASIICNTDDDINNLMNTLRKCTLKYQPLGCPNPYISDETSSTSGNEDSGRAYTTISNNSAASKAFGVKTNLAEGVRVIEVKNRFKRSAFNGYKDLVLFFAVDYFDDSHDEDSDGMARNFSALAEDEGEPKRKVAQLVCELQIHHRSMLDASNKLDSYSYYKFFRTYFESDWGESEKISAETRERDFANKLKALKTMDQVGEFVETLEAAMQVYLGGIGRVGKDLPRLSAYFRLFSRVNEVSLAEAMQTSIIKQLRASGRLHELFQALSELSRYFQSLKRYHHALPLSQEALEICSQLHGDSHLDTALQLTNHANLLYCCENLEDSVPLYIKALSIKKKKLWVNFTP